ncbi:MAG: DUF2309 domain-containing protein [Cyclobacteriaceae bacterium]|nr:DUF2309 domain-containing protein [Cyclobacteriaceae bacterium]MDX5465870.1 DUF2309 domain-containing protein [Cyclobacteriaceae bacterium]
MKLQPELDQVLQETFQKISPLWPLKNFVAVNPFLGLSQMKFDEAAQYLSRVGGIRLTMPSEFYLNQVKAGQIHGNPEIFSRQIQDIHDEELTIFSEVVSSKTGKDWTHYMVSRISAWASSYFDQGQASWKSANQDFGLFQAWKMEAELDLSPEIAGLKNFRKQIKNLPTDSNEMILKALEILDVPEVILPTYLHRLLLKIGGWSGYIAQLDWEAGLYGGQKGRLQEFLAILLGWEACLKQSLNSPNLNLRWEKAKLQHHHLTQGNSISQALAQKIKMQELYDQSVQQQLISKFKNNAFQKSEKSNRPKAQAVFCIDVRSEVYRRNLESQDPQIETFGFAGFFGFSINYQPIGQENGESLCPVLIPTGVNIQETKDSPEAIQRALDKKILGFTWNKLWKSFKSGAITCFSFVSPLGIFYLFRLLFSSFRNVFSGKKEIEIPKKKTPKITLEVKSHADKLTGIPLEKQVELAQNALRAISFPKELAPIILLVGHGSSSLNNPHASGLDCGACGGHSGEINSLVASTVLNNTKVRMALKSKGIEIPEDTVFLAAIHQTVSDEVKILNPEMIPNAETSRWLGHVLEKAGEQTRVERSLRFQEPTGKGESLIKRGLDWSQVRPEWGLAGCTAFVIASRSKTKNLNLEGKSFLHSYSWEQDEEFKVLEAIMTAPMVVTSWINLQYFASTVDNLHLGSGNKTLHNVTSGLGVLEGYSGDLRVGLPQQSIHDGENYQHDPARLNVVIEAPIEAINQILVKHRTLKDLFDNQWIFLFALNSQGQIAQQYQGDLDWKDVG